MAVNNPYNPNPQTADSLLRQRQQRGEAARQQYLTDNPPQPVDTSKDYTENVLTGGRVPTKEKFLRDVTSENPNDSFLKKVGKDAALLAYAIPVGIAKLGTGLVTNPIDTAVEFTEGVVQSLKDTVNPDYYKRHPLLGVVNLVGVVQPLAGLAKSTVVKGATNSAVETAIRDATRLGIEEGVARSAFKNKVVQDVVTRAIDTKDPRIVSEVIGNLGTQMGLSADAAYGIGTRVADDLYVIIEQQATKLKVFDSIQHPFGVTYGALRGASDPLRQAVFGRVAETAVGRLYGESVIAKDPEGFLNIEKWAEAQVKERGFSNTVDNRQRIMQEWVEQNSQWASLTPEERVTHFRNYAEADLKRLAIHEQTGLDIVTVKALPQDYVDAMVQTVKEFPKDKDMSELMKLMEDTYGRDFTNHSAEINVALAKNATREGLVSVLSKLGDSRSNVSFIKYSKETQALAAALEKTGYRIGLAPLDKEVSFAADVFRSKANEKAAAANATTKGFKPKEEPDVSLKNIQAKRTAFGAWLDRIGMSPRGLIEGAPEFAFREGFTQNVLKEIAPKYGGVIKAGTVSIPVAKLFEWIDNNRIKFQEARPRYSLPIRSVFDVKEDDLVRAGISREIARDIVSIAKKSLNNIPTEVTGMADAFINYLRTRDQGYNTWMSNVYDKYLRIAYKGRYDWSPFFSLQQWLETKLNSAMFLKDARFIPGVKGIQGLGNWTAEKLGKKVEESSSYLRKIIEEPELSEVAAVKEEILGSISKTMLDFANNPDPLATRINMPSEMANLSQRARFEKSIASENAFYHLFGQSNVRMATTFNKALAEKHGMSLAEALNYEIVGGKKVYKNPQLVQTMREATQGVYHYKTGFLTSPLMKTLNVIWFPLRFQTKTLGMVSNWLGTLSPASRMVVMNNWVHFANWAGTEEGRQWRIRNRNALYNIFSYSTAYEQMGQSIDAVTKGRLFGGNAGLIGGVPLGFFVNVARELSFIPSDPDQFDPKTGKPFSKFTPKDPVSLAAFSTAIEQLVISVSPSTPFYSLTGGVIAGISPQKLTTPLIRSILGGTREAIEGRDAAQGRKKLDKDFKKVPAEYTRFD